MKYRGIVLPVLIGFVAFLSGGWLIQRESASRSAVYQKARLFEEVLDHLTNYYVDSLDEGQLYDMAIDGMVNGLGDPYTAFLRAEDLENLTVSTSGNYGGLGIRIEVSDGWITVVTPLADTPAERAGIVAGDRIAEVDGESTHGWSVERAVSVLRGEPGSPVTIVVARPGLREPAVFTIERAEVHVTSVRHAEVLESGIAYVMLETVSEESANEVTEAVDRLVADGARALILDLRGNPGGLLDQGVAVSDLFLDAGDEVLTTQGRGPKAARRFQAKHPERWAGMPVIVLVNEYSASAAEIIAGALQDHDRALVVGTPTFGKGLVQTVFRMNRSEALKLTTGRWYTPSGRSIHRIRGAGARAAAMAAERSSPSAEIARADTTVFRSEAGRPIRGGGGIRPDVVAAADTLTDVEQEFVRVLGPAVQSFRDAMGAYALDLQSQNAVTDPAFEVSRAMWSELLRRLRARGVDMPETVWEGARQLVQREFTYQVLRYGFDRSIEMSQRIRDDIVVQRAAELLRQAATMDQLFQLAGRMDDAGTGQ